MEGIILLALVIPASFVVMLIMLLVKSAAQQRSLDKIDAQLKIITKELEVKSIVAEKAVKEEFAKSQYLRSNEIITPVKPIENIPAQENPIPHIKTKPELKTEEPLIVKPILQVLKIEPPALEKPIEKYVRSKAKAEKRTDWEKFIGENLANKIGISILVLGISFFVKYAIDNNWINEVGRVVIGLACGGLLIVIAHYFRNSYRSFSSVLVGGGISVFYFTIAFAFHEYKLLSQTSGFIIMIVITAFAVFLSLLYNRLELAVLATLGGYLTPFLISTGQNNYSALFTYLCILNTGMLVLAYFKQWKAINLISLLATVLIYGGWLVKQLWSSEAFPHQPAFLFATVFYLQFFAMNIINNVRLKLTFGGFDFAVLLSINLLFYTSGYIILNDWNDGAYTGFFTASLGIINLAIAWLFFKNKNIDRNFIYLLIGLTITFLSLTAPIQLKGNHITLFWSAEMVLLFWLYQRSGIRLLKITPLLISILVIISLVMDWNHVYFKSSNLLVVLANKGFITTLAAGIAFLIYQQLLRKEKDVSYWKNLLQKTVKNYLMLAGVIIIYFAGLLEITHQFSTRIPLVDIDTVYLQLYSFIFAVTVLTIFRNASSFSLLKFTVTILCVVLYVIYLTTNYQVALHMLQTGNYKIHFAAHWIAAALLFWLLYDLINYFRKNKESFYAYETAFTWIATFSLVFLLSMEMYYIIMWTNYNVRSGQFYWENLYYKAGLSILWGLSAFAMMWLGMKYKFKTLRIISLSLFTLTLAKLFLYDIKNIPAGGKIAAFIMLGVILLLISFMYQRLKKIIANDEGKQE